MIKRMPVYKEVRPAIVTTLNAEPTPSRKLSQSIQQRDHWRKLHTTLFTPHEFELWIQAIPGCSSCQRDFRRLIEHNPPRFDDWHKWTWEIHNAVNEKLGKQLIAWTDAIQLWGWSIKDIPDGFTEDSS